MKILKLEEYKEPVKIVSFMTRYGKLSVKDSKVELALLEGEMRLNNVSGHFYTEIYLGGQWLPVW